MGEQTGKPLWARAALWKSALVIAPLAATALFLASGTQAQTSDSTAQPNPPTASTTVAPIDAPDAARRGGPKGGGRDKELVGITAAPAVDVAPVEGRRKGPKGRSDSGRTEASPAPDTRPAERRKEGPKGDVDHGRIEATPAPDTAPVEGRRQGPKGDGESGRTEATPAPETQPTARRKGPKPRTDHGITNATPLIIGALGAATALALVVSSGNDRPASP
jgi:hypothetical protein